ncbi:alpha-2-HS-glycoprotein 2 [Brienomyrus brachyistius]|uniref:alpha-2-HS-glycoprotein 2 n=1 Tax=Brienomyrus brachyistius TaxID=42636 RepID=UPI0020B29969|nr:alpha-2-HS-glycoprotein 2 [Brienomyrus brachyistius]
MRLLVAIAISGLLASAKVPDHPNVHYPPCDSPEAEEAAILAQDYINAHHTQGYKYALNQIDEFKIIDKPDGQKTYLMELDLLDTKCHVLDPTPVANCTVRPEHETNIEADCDTVLNWDKGVLTVQAFKCKSKIDSRELPCVGCIELLPLNDTSGLELVKASVAAVNDKSSLPPERTYFDLLEVGRLSSQIVGGGAKISAEFVIVETNCTISDHDDSCAHGDHANASKIFCTSVQLPNEAAAIQCEHIKIRDGPSPPPHHHHHHQQPHLKHHKMIALHDPHNTSLLSESGESAEVPKVRRETVALKELFPAATRAPVPICPGKVRFF